MLKSFGLDKEMISANGSVCGAGIKSRNVPGTGPQGCHRALVLLLPTEALCLGSVSLEDPSQSWVTAGTGGAVGQGSILKDLCWMFDSFGVIMTGSGTGSSAATYIPGQVHTCTGLFCSSCLNPFPTHGEQLPVSQEDAHALPCSSCASAPGSPSHSGSFLPWAVPESQQGLKDRGPPQPPAHLGPPALQGQLWHPGAINSFSKPPRCPSSKTSWGQLFIFREIHGLSETPGCSAVVFWGRFCNGQPQTLVI